MFSSSNSSKKVCLNQNTVRCPTLQLVGIYQSDSWKSYCGGKASPDLWFIMIITLRNPTIPFKCKIKWRHYTLYVYNVRDDFRQHRAPRKGRIWNDGIRDKICSAITGQDVLGVYGTGGYSETRENLKMILKMMMKKEKRQTNKYFP